ncbi:MAG: hypothetical protein CTY24_12340 [Methylobacter sp.]|nr:MAG: hypothetical protein CTY24_12340 [Methylobacter sp.]
MIIPEQCWFSGYGNQMLLKDIKIQTAATIRRIGNLKSLATLNIKSRLGEAIISPSFPMRLFSRIFLR